MFQPRLNLAVILAVAGVVVATGCSSALGDATDAFIPFNTGDAGGSDDATPGPVYDVAADGGAAISLCGAMAKCAPDESTADKSLAVSCPVPAVPDGGSYSDGGSLSFGPACRLSSSGKDVTASCTTAGLGADGDACTVGADCAAGFECVSSPGRCRHYCCDPLSCKAVGQGSTNDMSFFCDIQTQTASNVKVPVCLPVQACKLLGNQCAQNQTCTIVDVVTGTTSCVQIGPAKVGESCETSHCGANLVCLGAPGKRSCQQLCDPTQPNSCPNNQTCKQPWSILKMDTAGICE